jgi:hypothetical protein
MDEVDAIAGLLAGKVDEVDAMEGVCSPAGSILKLLMLVEKSLCFQ